MRKLTLFGLLMLCLGQSAGAGRAQGTGIIVTRLRVSQPATLGRFATAECTIKNNGRTAVALNGVAVTLIGADGQAQKFAVSPPGPALSGGLSPGQVYTFRGFQQMKTLGDYACAVEGQDREGRWTALMFADGRAAKATLHIVPAASVPRVQFVVTDPNAAHVYTAGQTIRLPVLPVLTGGPDLSAQVSSVQITTPTKPFAMSDPATAAGLLHEKPFQADFWAVPEAQKSLDVTVTFARPVALSSWSLGGENLNNQYGLKECGAEVVQPDGTTVRLPIIRQLDGGRWTVVSASPQSVAANALHLRVSTAYKINLTDLTVQGNAGGGRMQAGSISVFAQWQDADGKPLSVRTPLPLFQTNILASPPHLPPGYCALMMTTHIPGVDDARREYGFAVLPPSLPTAVHDPRLGMVHMHLAEPHLGVRGVKTLGTNFFDESKFTLDAAGWQGAIAERRAQGLAELPLMADSDWASDSTKPVGPEQLGRIRGEMGQYFRATPDVQAWELGIEENLGYREHRKDWVYFWPNLEAKARAVREAAAEAHIAATLVYQIAETDPQTVEEFCRSRAARQFDVLSLHPYAWPDFPAPEQWMPPYLAQVHRVMTQYQAVKAIWFTEIGAPHNGNPGGFFGYPSIPAFDRGLSRAEHAAYLVKCHLVALRLGVAKVFWYTYQDGGDDPEYAEDHFGMIDFWGYPKPSYVAYSTMARELGGKPFANTSVLAQNVQAYRFRGKGEDCLVVWTYPVATKTVPLSALHLAPPQIAGIVDLLGKPVLLHGAALALTGDPLYIRVRR